MAGVLDSIALSVRVASTTPFIRKLSHLSFQLHGYLFICVVFVVYVRVCVRLFVGVVVWLLVCVYPFARPDHLPPTW